MQPVTSVASSVPASQLPAKSDPPYPPDSSDARKTRELTVNSYINCKRGGDQLRSTLSTTARHLEDGKRVNVSGYTTNPYSTSMDIVAQDGKVHLEITISRFVWAGPATYLNKGYELRPLEQGDVTELQPVELFPQNHRSEIPTEPLRFQFENSEVGFVGKARLYLFDLNDHPFKNR